VMHGVLPPLYGTQPLRAVTAALPSLRELGIDGSRPVAPRAVW
jgi:hypothetical protein